ncbi:MAG: GspE/PulE family protein [Planctomycetota bacterium]
MDFQELLQSRQFLGISAVWLIIGATLGVLYGWWRESHIVLKLLSFLGFFLIWPIYFPIWLIVGTIKRTQDGASFKEALSAQLAIRPIEEEEILEDRLELFDVRGESLSERIRNSRKSKEIKGLVMAHQFLEEAVVQRASDILIHPNNDQFSVRFRINGSLSNVDEISETHGRSVVNVFKAMSGMDIADRRRPQDGAFTGELDKKDRISFRVASAGVLNGEKVSIRILDQSASIFSLGTVGLSASDQEIVKKALHRESGMVLICGPTGSGKSSTVHAMLRTIDSVQRNVITIEDPIEYVLPNASQIEINKQAGVTFAATLRSVLRQDPDVISIGEIRDSETAGIALQAAQTGHLVFATVHSESNIAGLLRLIDLGCDPKLIGSAVKLIISQRLVRKLCDHCKKRASFTDQQSKSLYEQQLDPSCLYAAVGCDRCNSSGFGARTGVFDILPMNNEFRAKLAENKLHDQVSATMSPLQVRATQLALMGFTTYEEVLRLSASTE